MRPPRITAAPRGEGCQTAPVAAARPARGATPAAPTPTPCVPCGPPRAVQSLAVVVKGYSPHVIATRDDLERVVQEARNIQRLEHR